MRTTRNWWTRGLRWCDYRPCGSDIFVQRLPSSDPVRDFACIRARLQTCRPRPTSERRAASAARVLVRPTVRVVRPSHPCTACFYENAAMAIPLRRSNPTTIAVGLRMFFVTSSIVEKRNLLQSQRSAILFIEVLYHYRDERRYLLHGFVVMPDHFHVLITVEG